MAGCLGCFSKTEDEGNVQSALANTSERRCRDVICIPIFIVYWIGMAVVAFVALQSGNPHSLVYAKDYNGNTCGDGELVDKQFIVYPRLDEDIIAAAAQGIPFTSAPLFGICVNACPEPGTSTCSYDDSICWTSAQETISVLFRCLPIKSSNETVLEERCLDPPDADPACTADLYIAEECTLVCRTKQVQKAVWEVEATSSSPVSDQLQTHVATLGRFLSDMNTAKYLILLVAGAGSALLGVIWLGLLQVAASCIVWFTCVGVVLVLIMMSLFCSVRGGIIPPEDISSALDFLNSTASTLGANSTDRAELLLDSPNANVAQFKVVAYVLWVGTVVVCLVLLAMRQRVKIAIAVIRESSRAIRKMPLLLAWPVIPSTMFLTLVGYATAIGAYLLSSDDLTSSVQSTMELALNTTNTSSSDVDMSALESVAGKRLQQVLLVYHAFGFLWLNQFIQAVGICVLAGAVAQYYWTPIEDDGKRHMEAKFPIARALKWILRFSLGSLLFGSFIIAFVQLLRLIFEYIERNTRELQQSNRVVKVAFMIIKCCLWCFEKCLKFMTKNAYIIIAMKGKSFCSASMEAVGLIVSNVARVAVVNSISFFLLLLVKLTITLSTGIIIFTILSSESMRKQRSNLLGDEPVTSPLAPVLCSCVLSWLIASAFANVYETAIDTILLCFCVDTKMNNGKSSAYMSKELQKIMGGKSGKPKVIEVGAVKSPTNGENEEKGELDDDNS